MRARAKARERPARWSESQESVNPDSMPYTFPLSGTNARSADGVASQRPRSQRRRIELRNESTTNVIDARVDATTDCCSVRVMSWSTSSARWRHGRTTACVTIHAVCTNEQTPLIGASASRSSALSFVTLAGASGFLAEVSGAFRFVTSRLTGYSVPDTPSNLLQRGGSDCTVSHTSTS